MLGPNPGMKTVVRALAFAACLLPGVAEAQQPQYPQTLPPNTVVGHLGTTAGPSQAIPFAVLTAQLQLFTNVVVGPATSTVGDFALFGGTNGQSLTDGGAPGALAFLGVGTGLASSTGNLNLKPAAASAIGGVESLTCATHQWLNTISTLGVPACSQPGAGDISGGAALTGANDTNITLTLGGTPSAALLAATSLTLGWTGTLAVARGGIGTGTASGTALDNITGFSSTGFLTRTGTGTYAFQSATNGITRANLAQVAASSLSGNPTGSLANESAITLGSTLNFSGTTLNVTTGSSSQLGAVKCDNVTITCPGGVLTSSGGSATAVTVGTTSVGSPVGNGPLTSASGVLGNVIWGQLPGTPSNSLAGTGNVGELKSGTLNSSSGTGVSMSNGTGANIITVSLSAGAWDCNGIAEYNPSGPATVAQFNQSINTASGTLASRPTDALSTNSTPVTSTVSFFDFPIGPTRVTCTVGSCNGSGSLNVFLVGLVNFSAGTIFSGGALRCTRVY